MCPINIRTMIMDIVLAIVINTSATLLAGAPFAFATWYPLACAAFTTNVLMQLVIPVPTIASAISKRVTVPVPPMFVQVFFENLIFVTGISLTMAFIQTPAGGNVFLSWIATYIQLMLIGYVTSVILALIFQRVDESR